MAIIRQKLHECFASTEENHSQVINASLYKNVKLKCPKVFDALSCWDATPAGATAFQKCPDFIVGFEGNRYSYKTCTENGTWAKHPEGSTAWTNYTTCVDMDDLEFRNFVNNIYVVGYTLSVISLLMSLLIFNYFRTLNCIRIRVHMNLFFSFMIHNALWVAWYIYVVKEVTVVQQSYLWCQILHLLTHYFMASNYSWMFCESLHLHVSLVVVFVREDVAMKWFRIIGWLVPCIDITIYGTARYFSEDGTLRCWMDYHDTFWIITGPVVASLLVSLGFLVNIIRVLMTKLRPTGDRNNTDAALKAVRATIILIPLFGLHFILMPLRPAQGSSLEAVYEVVTAIVTSTQGLSISILFCFTNNDVIQAFKGSCKRHKRRDRMIPLSGMTARDSLGYTRTTATRGRSSRGSASRDRQSQGRTSQDRASQESDNMNRGSQISRDVPSQDRLSQESAI